MDERPIGWSFWSKLNPNLTFRLLLIIIFLILIAVGNAFSVYDSLIKQDITTASYSFISILLYIIPAYGLFKLRNWARRFELVFSFILIGLGIIMLLFDSVISGLFIITTHGLIAMYLLSSECKRALGIKN
ncbi:MAG: hypothetical protein GX348_06555 [Veillonellaceae bacterium]|jgi:low temperature requirement protein LtrA|nr:hypothetical protein [Veillonellaceae bacterium]